MYKHQKIIKIKKGNKIPKEMYKHSKIIKIKVNKN